MKQKITFDTCDAMWNMDGWERFCSLVLCSFQDGKAKEEVRDLMYYFNKNRCLSEISCLVLGNHLYPVIKKLPYGYDSYQGMELLRGLSRGGLSGGIEMRVKGGTVNEMVD